MEPAVSVSAEGIIRLQENERKILELLKEVVSHDESLTGLTIRVAGGWVRDKILGLESHDLDIALDITSGATFAHKVNAYMKEKGEEVHTVGVVQTNPEQSKHLETAIIRIHGTFIDMVNLRCEEYTENSRIPEIKIGTPLQDAERRDLTINSLFYNATNETIEDFTGKGLEDIRNKIIRTPLAPLTTFLDDPLRVLRTIRFAARFGYQIVPEIIEAASQESVRGSLATKISRERIGIEVAKALEGPRPVAVFHLLQVTGLTNAVFSFPSGVFSDDLSLQGIDYARRLHGIMKLHPVEKDYEESLRLSILAAYLLPIRSLTYKDAKNRDHAFSEFIIRESLKWKIKDGDVVESIHRNVDAMISLYKQFSDSQQVDRLEAGILLRQLGPLWKLCLRVALLLESAHPPASVSSFEDPSADYSITPPSTNFQEFIQYLVSQGLDGIWDMKPLLNGKELAQHLGIKPGPGLGVLLDLQTRWQIAHPSGDVAACKAYLLEEHSKIVSSGNKSK